MRQSPRCGFIDGHLETTTWPRIVSARFAAAVPAAGIALAGGNAKVAFISAGGHQQTSLVFDGAPARLHFHRNGGADGGRLLRDVQSGSGRWRYGSRMDGAGAV